jgi:riboflavin synthase
MFAGIVQGTGRVLSLEEQNGSGLCVEVDLSALASDVVEGESIAVNGCCLTVQRVQSGRGVFFLLDQTRRATNLGLLRPGDWVNLERALRVGDFLGGHWVTGHVDGVTRILVLEPRKEEFRLEIELLEPWKPYAVPKGSLAVDGISLTLAAVWEDRFLIGITPYTYGRTNLRKRRPGDLVNVEWDVLAKYLWHMLQYKRKSRKRAVSQWSKDR